MLTIIMTISRFVNKTFALWVVLSGVVGFLFPTVFSQVLPFVAPLLGIVMFGMGLCLSPNDFREVLRRPRDVAIGVIAQYTVMPLSAYAIALAFDLPPDLAVGLILLGCCPGGTASNVVTFLARGDVPLSVTITSCTTLLAPIVTPALMYLFANQWLHINPTSMFMSIIQIVLVPVVLGVIVNRIFGHRLESIQAGLPLVSVITIMVIVAGIVAKTHHDLATMGITIFLAVALQNAVGMAAGYFIGKAFKLKISKCKTLCFEVGMQNSALGVALSHLHFAMSPTTALASTIGALWHNITGPIVATWMQKQKDPSEGPSFFDRLEARERELRRTAVTP